MKVIIEQRHTLNTEYINCKDCGLARAIREQHPNVDLHTVADDYIRSGKFREEYCFDTREWNSIKFDLLKEGKLKQVVLDIPVPYYDNIQPVITPRIVYVSVPVSIIEQHQPVLS